MAPQLPQSGEPELDLDAYLARIGLRGRPTLAALHRAHVTAIPFENLDSRRGVPVSLRLADLERSLTHLLLRVRTEGEVWHADVGFGAGTLMEPIPFGPGGPYLQEGWRRRIVEHGAELVLQSSGSDGAWVDLYRFAPVPVPPIDIEMSNWFTCTHPQSNFVNHINVAVHRADGSRLVLSVRDGSTRLTEQTPAGRSPSRSIPPRSRRCSPSGSGWRAGRSTPAGCRCPPRRHRHRAAVIRRTVQRAFSDCAASRRATAGLCRTAELTANRLRRTRRPLRRMPRARSPGWARPLTA